MEKTKYRVLLYYKYVTLDNPEKIMRDQRELCERLDMRGRIIVSKEGINGTIEGTIENTEKYISYMETHKEFTGIDYKKSDGTGNAFPKLRVRVRPEIVTANLSHINPNKTTGKYLTSEELYDWFETQKEFYIVDMRNDYEYASGYFESSIPSGLHNFFDIKDVLPRIAHLKNKTIVTVCTGGVRCEKASGFLIENDFKDVYQLKNGIQTFMELYPNKYFKGKLYVFDNRLTLGFNTDDPDHEVVGRCMHCGTSCDLYVNCKYDMCHLHYICCLNCRDKESGLAFCKTECKEIYFKSINAKSL
ncbi:MAG TPA: rhodanese-related sulfurtransferase [Patescibacteria group bacterium]|nr:rhodanese-related sulfurtransferase [Patescibacteria group bacterium]